MKYIFLLLPIFSFAQKSEVVQDSIDNKQVIFSKSLAWVAKTWKSANDVVQMKDAESGIIIVKGGLASVPKALGMPVKNTFTFTTVTIICKDGKSKISFDDTYCKWEAANTIWKINDDKTAGQFTKWRDSSLVEIDKLIEDYKTTMNKKEDNF